ncbi:MAG: hypothetical protein M1814_006374 [Vezdaea aestivalis]|nr:MAG: hypothetical protein M1814_006374 [Vezdaea aestivalis]
MATKPSNVDEDGFEMVGSRRSRAPSQSSGSNHPLTFARPDQNGSRPPVSSRATYNPPPSSVPISPWRSVPPSGPTVHPSLTSDSWRSSSIRPDQSDRPPSSCVRPGRLTEAQAERFGVNHGMAGFADKVNQDTAFPVRARLAAPEFTSHTLISNWSNADGKNKPSYSQTPQFRDKNLFPSQPMLSDSDWGYGNTFRHFTSNGMVIEPGTLMWVPLATSQHHEGDAGQETGKVYDADGQLVFVKPRLVVVLNVYEDKFIVCIPLLTLAGQGLNKLRIAPFNYAPAVPAGYDGPFDRKNSTPYAPIPIHMVQNQEPIKRETVVGFTRPTTLGLAKVVPWFAAGIVELSYVLYLRRLLQWRLEGSIFKPKTSEMY